MKASLRKVFSRVSLVAPLVAVVAVLAIRHAVPNQALAYPAMGATLVVSAAIGFGLGLLALWRLTSEQRREILPLALVGITANVMLLGVFLIGP